MNESVARQTGWIHLIDLTVAFVFPVPILQTKGANPSPQPRPRWRPARRRDF